MATNEQIVALCVDARRGKVKNYSDGDADKAFRNACLNILGVDSADKIDYRAWKKHKDEIFEIIEDTLVQTIPDAWDNSEYFREFVEVKNARLGQKNEFIVEDNSTLLVSRFSGNHWDIDRQKLPAGKVFTLETEWYGVAVYDEWERFMRGVTSIVKMYDAIQKAYQRFIDEHVYAAFNGAGTYLPTEFKETGTFDKDKLLNLAIRVQTASGRMVHFAGTRQALAKLDGAVSVNWISNEMKQDKNAFGYLKTWEGFSTIEIPQTFNRGTFDFKSPDNKIFVLPMSYKPIKLFFEGDPRSRERNQYDNHDMTIDYEVQLKMGTGVVFDSVFGEYTITG